MRFAAMQMILLRCILALLEILLVSAQNTSVARSAVNIFQISSSSGSGSTSSGSSSSSSGSSSSDESGPETPEDAHGVEEALFSGRVFGQVNWASCSPLLQRLPSGQHIRGWRPNTSRPGEIKTPFELVSPDRQCMLRIEADATYLERWMAVRVSDAALRRRVWTLLTHCIENVAQPSWGGFATIGLPESLRHIKSSWWMGVRVSHGQYCETREPVCEHQEFEFMATNRRDADGLVGNSCPALSNDYPRSMETYFKAGLN